MKHLILLLLCACSAGVASLPPSVTPTNNGSASAVGTTLAPNQTLTSSPIPSPTSSPTPPPTPSPTPTPQWVTVTFCVAIPTPAGQTPAPGATPRETCPPTPTPSPGG